MKIHRLLLGIGVLLFFVIAGAPRALANTSITGTAYGKNTGLLHMDYTTALRPEDFAGSQRDYYISPAESQALEPPLPTPGLPAFTAQIRDFEDVGGCDENGCLLTGFLWSDAIGWIILNGQQIQNALPDPQDFPENFFARIYLTGGVSGYAWSENAGWIRFSSSDVGEVTTVADQNAANWGIYVDASEEVVIDERDPGDPEDDVILGRPFHGYGWSERLGWIKWGDEGGDPLSFGAYTTWVPDATPPEFYAENNVWFANAHELGVIEWPAIAEDRESRLREDSHFEVARDPSENFLSCNEPVAVGFQIIDSGYQISLTIPSVGLLQNAALGYCKYNLTGEIFNNAGLRTSIDPPLTFYVRAGTPLLVDDDGAEKSRIELPLTSTAIADGNQGIRYALKLVDLAENPVVDIDCEGCPARQITAQGVFNNDMHYDSILLDTNPPPVLANQAYLEDRGGEVLAPVGGLTAVAGDYPLSIASFAPTLGGNSLKLIQINAHVEDEALPRLTSNLLEFPAAETNLEISIPEVSQSMSFEPSLLATNPQVATGGAVNELIDGAQAELNFSLLNQSPSEILESVDLDTVFEYYADAGGVGGALLETHAIEPEPAIDGILGWLDPIAPIEGAHLEMVNGDLAPGGPSLDGTNGLFSAVYPLEKEVGVPANLQVDGSYDISGIYDIPEVIEDDQFGQIDRSDQIPVTLGAGAQSDPFAFQFTPAFLVIPPELDVSDLNLRIKQQIGYRFADQPLFTLYEPLAPLLSGLNINAAGASFTGIGVGKSIFEDQLNVIGEQGVKGLKEQIRRNVAELSLNRTACAPSSSPTEEQGGELTLSASGPCVRVDETSNTIVALYEGNSGQTLELGDGVNTVNVPAGTRYTLILKGGLNLFIRSNLAYAAGDNASSLGLILLAQEGVGANVYLAPEPTNLVGNLFTEGSLLSSADGETLYYGAGGANPQALTNQLYWQGSLASLNTLGGAGRSVRPEGVTCPGGLTPYECAQRYDLNFIRRFSITQAGDGVLNQGLFSGGGSCDAGVCSLGPLPTTLTLSGDLIDRNASKSVDAFFLEPTNRPAPPGFTLTAGQQSIEVIR